MDNKDLYKKAMDKISAPEKLKKKTIDKINSKQKEKTAYLKYLVACSVFVLAMFGIYYVSEQRNYIEENTLYSAIPKEEVPKINLPTFKDTEELKSVLKEKVGNTRGYYTDAIKKTEAVADLANTESSLNSEEQALDYSTTNVQVEGVDEADIVKTDGRNIYYLNNGKIYVVKENSFELVNKIDFTSDRTIPTSVFNPNQLYLVKDKLVVIGNEHFYNIVQDSTNETIAKDVAYTNSYNYATAMIYDVSNPEDIKKVREVKLDGVYSNSRMIGNNLYFISTKSAVYYDQIKDTELLPCFVNNEKKEYISANRIVCFNGTDNYDYILVGGVDITKNEEMSVETFFGGWSKEIYVSLDNLYIFVTHQTGIYENDEYAGEDITNEIYKFNLSNAKVSFASKGEVKGGINNQFSIDEYNGYLRVATTAGYEESSSSTLYIFNDKLEEVSKLEDIGKGERIYSVRFMGKTGYIVTFEQIDPLFVLDLSDPNNPTIKGELELPGYSSYLHPYDETHIIGIGYNVKSNGNGGVTNTNMKMAMFDVSDLSNPKEMFNVSFGSSNVFSEIAYNHKILLYNKNRNLIGFPISDYKNNTNDLYLYHIDLEKGFEEAGKISQKLNSGDRINRSIYIGDNLYTLSYFKVTKYNLDSFEKIQELNLVED